jgi:hypothetical protein
VAYYEKCLGKSLPKIFIDTKKREPIIVFNHYEMLQDIYVNKNKYYDKDPLVRERLQDIMGRASLFDSSNGEWV